MVVLAQIRDDAKFLWIFDSGESFTDTANKQSTKMHVFYEEGIRTINITISWKNATYKYTFHVVAVKEAYVFYLFNDIPSTEVNKSHNVSILATILNERLWTFVMDCSFRQQFTAILQPAAGNNSICWETLTFIEIYFDSPDTYHCSLMTTDGMKSFYLGQIPYHVYPKIESVRVMAESYVETNSQTSVTVEVMPKLKDSNSMTYLHFIDENSKTVFKTKYSNTLTYIFEIPGVYKIIATVLTPFMKLTNEKLIIVQNPVTDVHVISPKPLEHVKVHSNIKFIARVIDNSNISCLWILQCIHVTMFKTMNYETRIEKCDSSKKFRTHSTCSVTLTVFNNVSKLELRDKFKIYVEEHVSVLETYVPPIVKLNSEVVVVVYVKNNPQNVIVDINTSSANLKAVYDHELLGYKAKLSFKNLAFEIVRIKVSNNVSNVILRRKVTVVQVIKKVEIKNIGCTAVGFPVRVLVLVEGSLPTNGDGYLYHWTMETYQGNVSFYTSLPLAETKVVPSVGRVRIHVNVSNEVSATTASLIVNLTEEVLITCLNNSLTFRPRQWIDVALLGLRPDLQLLNLTLEIRNEKTQRVSFKQWIQESKDTSIIPRFPIFLSAHAEVKPHFYGCVFYWNINDHTYVTARPELSIHLHLPIGQHTLDLEVWNAVDNVNASMVFAVARTLLLLNYTLSNFFTNQNGSIFLKINDPILPQMIFVDFGDDTVFDSNVDSWSNLSHLPYEDSSVLTLSHVYRYAGLYDVYVNITNSASGFDQWVTVIVEERISGVELHLLSPPIVELLKEVTVTCLVQRGSNLQFKWDFGDGSEGEQYTRQETYQVDRFKTNSTAHHSYGIAQTYNVSVNIFNTYESITVFLNTSIQAVEPIVELHLHPRLRGRYAAPLYRKKVDNGVVTSLYSTAPIEFETGVWRGSDVQFLFDFGDGNTKEVPALLNAWSLPYAIVRHSYIAEGKYNVSVTATNLLNSVNASLGRPFYVQFPPENLMLDKQYYIIEHHADITLRASVSLGTNVSYNWIVGDMHMTDAGDTLYLPVLNPGIYVVFVEAFNQVTDFGYNTIRRPNATAKIYVQEKLLGIRICVIVNFSEICNPGVLDLSLDEEIKFQAKVMPSTETVLRFIWQLGIQDIRRTNVPYLTHRYQQAGWYSINVTAQNHISSISSMPLQLNLVQKVANLTSIFCQGPNLVNHPITFRALYWFGTNLTFLWDFGDGSFPITTTVSTVQHTYKEVGEYWVSVNVWNKFSHANITTNMFFLHDMCRKPEITFLHSHNRIINYDDDTLLEADIFVMCKTFNVEYLWSIKTLEGTAINFDTDYLVQRQLLIPRHFLPPGIYNIQLKVNMMRTIVYAESSTSLEIVPSKPLIYLEGGFVRWVGVNDSRVMIASVKNVQNVQPLRYIWSCTPQIQKHLPCFRNSDILSVTSPVLTVPTSQILPNLGAIIINVTVEGNEILSASQLLEMKMIPHMLQVDIECVECHDHHVNQQDKIIFKANCNNCGPGNLEYHWKIWIIEDGKFRLHFGNYDCVQADGSTFFIMAPNITIEEHIHNITFLSPESMPSFMRNDTVDHMLAEKPYEAVTEDLPPFPSLPGFPEENNTLAEPKLIRKIRNTFDEEIFESSDLIPSYEYPYEGDADYDADNSSFIDFSYPDFMPFPAPGLSPEGPDYLITEEGMPGESGSAAARHQSSQNLGILLSEDEDQILEGPGKPRMKSSGSTNILDHNTNELGDPLRDRLSRKNPVPHIVSRPRGLLANTESASTTGFTSEYLVLKPGTLKMGRSYLVQVRVGHSDNIQEGIAMEYFKVNVGPFNGRCTLMPLEGYSINFDFRLHCFEWKSDHLPLYYELSYSKTPNDYGHLIYFGLNGNIKFNLPQGLTSNSNDVHLSVIVRDSLGAATKVCSIVRKVRPLQVNMSLENIVYNETFHPRSILKKLIGEKNNQGVLQKLHVLASSLNNYEYITMQDINSEFVVTRNKIRQGFFEVLNNLQISSKVEATQVISVLNEIISDVKTIKLFDLQKAYNVYQNIITIQAELLDFFAFDQLHMQFIIFLSKLAFAAHSLQPENAELIEIAREDIINEMNDSLQIRFPQEEPLKINIPHLSASAFYILEASLLSKSIIYLKKTAVHLLDNHDLIFSLEKGVKKRCIHSDCNKKEKCFMFVIQEYDYVSLPTFSNFWKSEMSPESSVFMSLKSCQEVEDKKMNMLNVSVHFARPENLINKTTVIMKKNYMNIHRINITEKHMKHALMFHLKFDDTNMTEGSAAIDIMLRHLSPPTLTKYDMKKSYPPGTFEMNIVISPNFIIEPSLYYISILNRNFLLKKTNKDIAWQYEVSLWKDICLEKMSETWSHKNCYVMKTTNINWTHCRCSSQEVTAFSEPVEWIFSEIPINELMEPYINPLPSLVFVIVILMYMLLWYLNLQKDKYKNLSCCPLELKDNNTKHKQFYLIYLQTGYYFSSGTTASVYIVLHGTKDGTETRQLIGKDTRKLSFQKGSTDVFLLSTERNLGPLLKLDIWHDNQGDSPSWYLKTICVKDLNTGSNYVFNCYNWLAAERGDGQIERELTVAENPPSFKKVFYENIVAFMNDFNMWNSVVCETPVSFFTGIQRVTCCLCFFLNCGFIMALFEDNTVQEVVEEDSLPHVTLGVLFTSIICAAISTIPQMFYTLLFRFSQRPFLDIKPGFANLSNWLSFFNFNCLLKPKHSSSSHSTNRSSSSISGSDSLYSSFEESSIMSVPLGESFSLEEDEKHGFPLSFSCPDISDPVSPLQKTLSTWQTLENWLKKKQDMILKPEIMLMKRHSAAESSSGALDNSRLDSSEDITSEAWHQSDLSIKYDIDNSTDLQSVSEELDLIGLYPCLPSVFYYLNWIFLIVNIIYASVSVLTKASKFSVLYNILLFKSILISLVLSCVCITPALILVLSLVYSLKSLCASTKWHNSDSVDTTCHEKKSSKVECLESSYSRIEYFKKYFRPPKEQVLEQFRLIAIGQKRICSFYNDTWNFIFLLILLVVTTYPNDMHLKYLQKTSIEKVLFQSISKTTKSLPSKLALLSWLETDYLDSFFVDHQCHDTDEDCGLSTGCILVGGIIMRHFYSSHCPLSGCELQNDTNLRHDDFGDIYEARVLKGYYHSYYYEDEWFVMTDQIFYSYDEIQNFVDKINSSSSAASIEFLLFNPSISIFTSVSLFFEMTPAGSIIVSFEILPMTLSDRNDLFNYLKMFFNLILFTYIIFNCKNHLWKMMKHKYEYWSQPWNYFACLFILTYFIYLTFFVLCVIASERVTLKLQATQLNSNINITGVVLLENITHSCIGILMFLHAMRLFKILTFSARLKKLLKRLQFSQKKVLIAVVSFFIIVLSSVVMTKCFVGSSTSFSHPLFGFVKVFTVIFSYSGRPEIGDDISMFGQFLSIIVILALIIIHLYLFSVIRSILLNCNHETNCLTNKTVTISDIRSIIRKQFRTYFKSKANLGVSQIEYVPPIDFLLYELERLADALLSKANSLFPDINDLEHISESEFDFEKIKLESGLDLLTNAIDVCNIKFDEHDSSSLDRLISTIPRRTKTKLDAIMPSSFHASLGSEKKYKPAEASTTLLQNRIRKTYPLSHLDSDSSLSSSHSHADENIDSGSSLLFRKTKSRGKGKIESFDLDIEVSDDQS